MTGLTRSRRRPSARSSSSSLPSEPFADEHVDVALALASSCSTRWRPMKPVAPVTKYVMGLLFSSGPVGTEAYTPAPAAAAALAAGEAARAARRRRRTPRARPRPRARGRPRAAGRGRPARRGGRRASSPAGSARGPRRSRSARSRWRAGSTTSVTRPIAQRLGGVDDAPGEDQVERAAQADDPRQALRAAVDERDAPAALGEAEARALGGDRAGRTTARAPGRRPGTSREIAAIVGLDGVQAGEAERAARAPAAAGAKRLERLEVGAGAEGSRRPRR